MKCNRKRGYFNVTPYFPSKNIRNYGLHCPESVLCQLQICSLLEASGTTVIMGGASVGQRERERETYIWDEEEEEEEEEEEGLTS